MCSMSVHFAPKEDPNRKNTTVKHSKPFCSCYNGQECQEMATSGEPGGRVKKALRRLETRQKVYDGMRADDKGRFHHTKRPGSFRK